MSHINTKGECYDKEKRYFCASSADGGFYFDSLTAETVNQVLTLSETAAFIYERAESAKTAEQLVRFVSREYQVDEEDVREDVEEILETLKTAGILEETEEKA